MNNETAEGHLLFEDFRSSTKVSSGIRFEGPLWYRVSFTRYVSVVYLVESVTFMED